MPVPRMAVRGRRGLVPENPAGVIEVPVFHDDVVGVGLLPAAAGAAVRRVLLSRHFYATIGERRLTCCTVYADGVKVKVCFVLRLTFSN